jgi:hypothetical protein
MKPVIAILSFLFAGSFCSAQTPKEKFITYSLQIDRAETAAAHNEHVQAMAIYDSAFVLLPFMAPDYFDAVLNALAAGSDDRANDLLIQGAENGMSVEGMYDSTLQAFLLSERSMPYLNMREYMKTRWLQHADTAMINMVGNIGDGNLTIEDSNGAIVQVPDTTAFDRLLAMAQKHGFPTPLAVGSNFYIIQSLLFNQLEDYPDSPKWQQILPYIRSAIDRGALPADYLAPFQDMADLAAGRPMSYGVMLSFYRKDPDKWLLVDRKTLAKNRQSVGLGPIEDYVFRWGLDPELVRFAKP